MGAFKLLLVNLYLNGSKYNIQILDLFNTFKVSVLLLLLAYNLLLIFPLLTLCNTNIADSYELWKSEVAPCYHCGFAFQFLYHLTITWLISRNKAVLNCLSMNETVLYQS